MIKKIHKIPDRVFFKSVFLVVILLTLKYFFLPLQVMFTALTVPFFEQNSCYSVVQKIKSAINPIKDFYDEGVIGFTSDVKGSAVFDLKESIKSYYLVQYAIVPAILKNDIEEKYVIGSFFEKPDFPIGFHLEKEITENLYVLKKDNR